MRRIRLLILAAALGAGFTVPLLSHHSMSGYDSSTVVIIKGTVTRIEWRNPHTWITLTVTKADGTSGSQRIEIAGPSHLRELGFERDLLSIGDSVTFEAWLPKDGTFLNEPSGRVIMLADGRRFDVGDNWLASRTNASR